MCICQSVRVVVHVEVRGQLSGVGSAPPIGPRGSTQVLGRKRQAPLPFSVVLNPLLRLGVEVGSRNGVAVDLESKVQFPCNL